MARKSALPKTEKVLKDALDTVTGPRQKAYGHPSRNLGDIAKMWSIIVDKEITPRQVCSMMVALKICRDKNKPTEDNAVDIVGYGSLMPEVTP